MRKSNHSGRCATIKLEVETVAPLSKCLASFVIRACTHTNTNCTRTTIQTAARPSNYMCRPSRDYQNLLRRVFSCLASFVTRACIQTNTKCTKATIQAAARPSNQMCRPSHHYQKLVRRVYACLASFVIRACIQTNTRCTKTISVCVYMSLYVTHDNIYIYISSNALTATVRASLFCRGHISGIFELPVAPPGGEGGPKN